MKYTRIAFLLIGIIFLVGVSAAFSEFPCYYDDTTPDGKTCCVSIPNLQPENYNLLSGPRVVDIDETTGNLLVRGPLPLIVRKDPGKKGNCTDYSDWRFAYEEFNTLMPKRNSVAPVYFSDSKKGKLFRDMQNFSLDNYQVLDIALLDHGQPNQYEFEAIQREFGGKVNTCNASPLAEGTLHGRKANLISSEFKFCSNTGVDDACNTTIYNDVDNACSYKNRIDQIINLMTEKAPSGKPRLIYYHCALGSDRTGSVTIGYLQKTIPNMSFIHALRYAWYLGKENQFPDANWSVNPGAMNAALAYCQQIHGDCTIKEAPPIVLPGRDMHSHIPGQEDPVVIPTPTAVPVLVQTPVPGHYNPATSKDIQF